MLATTEVSLEVNEIGENAGRIYDYVREHEECTLSALKKSLKLVKYFDSSWSTLCLVTSKYSPAFTNESPLALLSKIATYFSHKELGL